MAIRRRSRSLGTLIGGAMSVDIVHTSDSVTLGDETNKLVFSDVGGTKAIPVDVIQTVGGGGSGTSMTDDAAFTPGTTSFTPVGGTYRSAGDNLDDGDGGAVALTQARAMHVYIKGTDVGAAGGTSATDDADFTAGTSDMTPIGGVYQSSPSSVTDGDMGTIGITQTRAVRAQIENASIAVTGTFWQATQPVSGTVSVTGVATETTLDAIKTASELIDDMIATIAAAVPTKAAFVAGTDGTNARALKTDASGELQIDVLSSALPSGASTLAEQQTQTTALSAIQTAVEVIDNAISGTEMQVDVVGALPAGTNNIGDVDVLSLPGITGAAAHDAAVSGNPVRVAGRAMLANGTSVAEDDTADIATDNQGRVLTTPHVPRDLTVHGNATLTSTTQTTLISAGAAGVFHDVVKLVFTNSSSTATRVAVKDATSGTTRIEVALAANGGAVIDFGSVPLTQATAANNWTVTLSGAVTSVYCFGQAIKRIA